MTCLNCKSDDLEYDSFDVEGMYYKVSCNKCTTRFWESDDGEQGVIV